MPIFEYEGKKYRVSDEKLNKFTEEFPNAVTYEERGGKKFRVSAKKYNKFIQEFGSPNIQDGTTVERRGQDDAPMDGAALKEWQKDMLKNPERFHLEDNSNREQTVQTYLENQDSLQDRVDAAKREAEQAKSVGMSEIDRFFAGRGMAKPTQDGYIAQGDAIRVAPKSADILMADMNSDKKVFEREEDERINLSYVAKPVNNEADIRENYANKFALTERGKKLGEELASIEKGISDQYAKEFLDSDEYKTLQTEARAKAKDAKTQEEFDAINNEFNERSNKLYNERYGNAIANDMQPYRRAYDEALVARYGTDMEDEVYKLRKAQSADALSEMTAKVDELLAGEEKAREEKADEMRKRFGHSGRTFGGLTSGRGIVSERYDLGAKSAYLRDAKKQLEQAQETLEAAKNGTFASGLGNVFDWDKWTFGVSDMAQAANLNKVVTKSSEGKELTEDEQALLDAALMNMTIQGFYADDLNGWYKAGQVTADSLPFMFEMIINPVSGSGNAIAKGLLKYGLKKYALTGARNKAAKKAINVAANILGHSAPAAVMTGTTSMGSVAAGTLEHLNQNYDIKQDGDGRVIAVRNDNNMGVGEVFARSAGSRFFENQSEMIFNAFPGVKNALSKATQGLLPGGAPEFISRLGATKIGNLWTQVRNNPYMRGMRKRAQIGGIGEEYLEEVYNNFANVAIGEMSMEDATSLQNNVDTFLGLVPTQLFFSAMGIGGYAVERRKNTKAIERYRGMLTEDVQREVEAVANAAIGNPERLNDYVMEVTLDGSIVPEQKSARIALANELNKRNLLDGIDEAKQTEEVTPQEAAVEAGISAETPEEKHAINKRYENAVTWRASLTDEDGQLGAILDMEDRYAAVSALEEQGYGDRMQEAFDYWAAMDAYEGMAIGAANRVDEAVADANMQAARNAHVDGRIIEATTADRGVVYVKSGNIAWNDDGTINVALSDPQLFVVNEEGQVEMMSPRNITAVAERGTLQAQREYNNTTLREQLEKEEADAVELNPNTPSVAPGLTYTDEQGNQMVVMGVQDGVATVASATDKNAVPAGVPVDEIRGMLSARLDAEEGARRESDAAGTAAVDGVNGADGANDGNLSLKTGENEGASVGGIEQSVSESADNGSNMAETPAVTETPATAVTETPKTEEGIKAENKKKLATITQMEDADARKLLYDYYGEQMKHKATVNREAADKKLEAAQKAVEKAQQKYDDAPIEEEDKAEVALAKAKDALTEAQRVADFWGRIDNGFKGVDEVKSAPQMDARLLEPMSPEERVAQALGSGEIKLTRESFLKETGYGNGEARGFIGLFATKEKGGISIERAAEYLVAREGLALETNSEAEPLFGGDTQYARGVILDVLSQTRKMSELRNYIANNRKASAEADMRSEREAYEAWTMGSYGMTPEEYEDYVQMLEESRPSDVAVEEIRAIFAEVYLEEENRLNNNDNGQERISESVEGSNEVLLGEQADLEGGDAAISEGGQGNEAGLGIDSADAASQEEAGEIKPVELGENSWGKVFQWVKGKVVDAAKFLKKSQNGYLRGVFYREELGDIDLFWGNEKGGLARIIDKHIIKHSDFASVEDAVSVIDDVISTGEIIEQPNGRIAFLKDGYRVVTERTFEGNWVVTAFDETVKQKDKKRSEEDATRLHQDIFGKENGELVSPNSASEGKGSESSVNEQGIEGISSEKEGENGLNGTKEDGKSVGDVIDSHVTEIADAYKSGDTKETRAAKPKKVDNDVTRTRNVPASDVMGRVENIANDYWREREEKRRKPLRERVKQWGHALGVKVYIVERLDDVTDRAARRAIESGRKVAGWRTANGEVVVYMPFNSSVKEIDKTVLHELVGHDGLRGLLGKEGFDALCDKVWDMMPKNAQTRYFNYLGVKDIEDKTERRRAAADEYMANLAEREKLLPQQKNLWNRIVEAIRELFGKRLGKDEILAKDNLKKGDIVELLRLSYQRMAERRDEFDESNGADGSNETRFRFSRTPEEFEATQKEAVEKKGIVSPGLNEAVLDVVSVPKHDFTGRGIDAIRKAKKWANENISGEHTYHEGLEDEFEYIINEDAIDKFLSSSSTTESDNLGVHLAVLKKLPEVVDNSIEAEIHPDYKKVDKSRSAENGVNREDLLVHRLYGAVGIDGKIYRAKTTIHEFKDKDNEAYTYKITEVKLIVSGSTTSNARTNSTSISAAKVLENVEKSYDKGKKLLEESEKTRFRDVFHGTAAEFDRFDHAFMGSGEGNQSFGWGTYVTEVEGIGRRYADVALHGGNKFTYVGDKKPNEWVLADAEQIMDRAGSYDAAMERYGSATLAPGTALEQAVTFLKSTKAEDWRGNRLLYEVEIPDEKRGNYIKLGNTVTDKTVDRVFGEMYKQLVETEGYDSAFARKALRDELDGLRGVYGQGAAGTWKDLHGDIAAYMGGQKEASLFLNGLGYVGIKYPAESMTGGRVDGASNYVIFNEDDLKIKERTRFREYKSKDGKETKYRQLSLLFNEEGEASADGASANKVQRKDNQRLSTLNHLRELQEGEICHVERRFTETGGFDFIRGEKVESAADIAYIFKNLEDESIENSFVALVKDDDVTVLHIGMGAQSMTVVDSTAVLAAVDRLGADKVFFVHNHPSGDVKCSRDDIMTYRGLSSALGNKLQEGIIINTRSGQYGVFNDEGLISTDSKVSEGSAEDYPLKVYKFNKQAFHSNEIPSVRASSYDIAQFISTQRLGSRDKINALLLNNHFGCVGNVFLSETSITSANAGKVVSELVADAVAMGARNIVLYGRSSFIEVTDRGTGLIPIQGAVYAASVGNIRLVDVIEVGDGVYRSANDEGTTFREIEELNERFNAELQQQIDGVLPRGHVYQLGMPSEVLRSTGVPMLPIMLQASVLNRKANDENHPFELSEVKDLVKLIQKPIAIFEYGDKGKAQNLMIGLSQADAEGKQFLVGLSLNPVVNGRALEINSVRNVFPKNYHDWVYWINQGKVLRIDNKEEIQNIINALRINPVDYIDDNALDSAAKIVEEFENPKLPSENVTRFREANENQAVFVSNAEKAVKGIKQEKATPEQWLKMIEKQGGLKAGEDKWLGLSEWLKASEAKTLTKDEVLDFIGENRIQIEEVKYSGVGLSDFSNEKLDALNAEFEELIWEGDEETGSVYTSDWVDYAYEQMVDRYGDDFRDAFEIEGTGTNTTLVPTLDYNDEISGAARHFLGIGDATGKPINSTRLDYTTEGLDNKREIALVVPTIESWNENDEIHFGDAGEGRAVAWVRFGETFTYEEEELSKEVTELKEPYKDVNGRDIYKTDDGSDTDFIVYGRGKSGDMIYVAVVDGNQIPVAHKTLEDAKEEMNKYFKEHPTKHRRKRSVLVIDEIQSNRHQEGREKGYDSITPEERSELRVLTFNRSNSNDYRRAINEAADILSAKGLLGSQETQKKYFYEDSWMPLNGKADEFEAEYGKEAADILNAAANIIKEREERIAELKKKEGKVPAAPFEKNWHELAMKRMLRLAAEEGFDKVAWTTGAQQAERYDLASRVDEIKVTGGADNIFTVIGRKDGGILLQKDAEGEQGLAELLGKDLARKAYSNLKEGKDDYLNEDGAVSFTGDNLSIGGEGMKGFYDKMLPSFVQKYVKKWGAKVGEVELPELEESARKMWSVDVTTEMKESVMEGQTMFRVRENESIEEIVEIFKERYDTAPIDVFRSTDEITNKLGELNVSDRDIQEVLDAFKKGEIMGAYTPDYKRIFIFAPSIDSDIDLWDTLKHESTHAADFGLFDDAEIEHLSNELKKVLDQTAYGRKMLNLLEEEYGKIGREAGEETIAYFMDGYEIDNGTILGLIDEKGNKLYNKLLDYIGNGSRKKLVGQSERKREGDTSKSRIRRGSVGRTSEERAGYEAGRKGKTDTSGFRWGKVDGRGTDNRGTEIQSERGVSKEFSESGKRQDVILDEVIRLEEELGTAVNAIDSFDALPEGRAKDAIAEGRKVLGWYQGGRVYVYLPNARSAGDVRATVYHEVVGHLGLREMLGDRFNAFLDRVYMNLPADVRAELNSRAMRKGWDFREATEEYMAELAERFARGEKVSGLRKVLYAVRDAVVKALRSLGIDLGFEMSDNYLMYVLWASKQNLKPSNVMGRIADRYMRNVLNVEGDVVRPTPPTRPTGTDGSNGLRFREVEPEDDVTRMTREAYEKNLKSLSYRLREGFQDSMLSLKELQDAIVKTLGHDLEEYENAYVEENHLSSKNTAEFDYLTNGKATEL